MKTKLNLLILFSALSYFAYGQGNYPNRDTNFGCSCQGDGVQPYPQPYYSVVHYILKPNGDKVIIAQFCNYIEFSPNYKVVADGGVSYIEIESRCTMLQDFPFLDDPNFDLNGDLPSPAIYGRLSIEFRGPIKLILKYEHPTAPPDGVKSFIVTPFLGFFTGDIEIFHPPVAMIHGLWADRSSFDIMETNLMNSGLYNSYQLYKIDYKSSNDQYFVNNQFVASTGIDQLLGQCWDEFMAVTKVNVVCHSMGGLLTRKFVQSGSYLDHKSVNKIITCNTPHSGSQMANWLLDAPNFSQTPAAFLLNEMGMSSFHGAVSDLRVTSSAIAGIRTGTPVDPVRVHAINTVQQHDASLYGFFLGPGLKFVLFQILNKCGSNFLTDVFDTTDSDLVVALESQAGGLSGLNTELYNGQMHVGSVANGQVMTAVGESLKLPNTDANHFGNQFSGNYLYYNVSSNCLFNANQPSKEAKKIVADLQITAPNINQNIIAGSDLTISFTSSVEIDSVVAYLPQTQQNFAIKKVKFSENTFILPTDIALFGPVKLVLAGYSATNEMLIIASVIYNQTTTATLNSIYTYPTSVYLHQNDSLAVDIFGKYSDGIDRNITSDPNLSFSFLHGSASKINANIVLNNNENDTLTVSYGIPSARIAADPIQLVVNTLDQTQTPLPVILLSFTGKATENGNLLHWKTANETNFSHFEIERSSPLAPDGGTSSQKFEKIGKKDSNESKNYELLDINAPSGGWGDRGFGTVYYRLKLIDLDGKYSYSKIISIINTDQTPPSGAWGAVFPNPFSNQISIDNSENKEMKISLIDLTGREIIKPINSNSKKIDLNTEKIGTGIYFLQIKEGEKVKIKKLIKQ